MKATTATRTLLAGGPVHASLGRQHLTAPEMHTMEVVAAGTGLNFCVAIDNLLQELGIKQGRLTPYYLDSLSSVHVGKRDKAVKLSAWLQRRTLVLHESSDTEVLIIHIPGTDMLADPFTKYLKYETWRRHMDVLLNRPETF